MVVVQESLSAWPQIGHHGFYNRFNPLFRLSTLPSLAPGFIALAGRFTPLVTPPVVLLPIEVFFMPSAVGFSFSPSFAFNFSFSSLDGGGTEDRAELVCAEPCSGGGASCGLGDRRCTGGGTEVGAEVEGALAGDKKGSPRDTVSGSVLAGVDRSLA